MGNNNITYFIYKAPGKDFYVFSQNDHLIYASFSSEVDNKLLEKATLAPQTPALSMAAKWLDCYFAGKDPGFLPPLYYEGTPFQNRIWKLLLELEFGSLTTYGALAKRIAKERGQLKMSAQAVGGAVGSNPLSLFIPCHRVVGQSNQLVGYGGGLNIKRMLLHNEGHDIKEFK